MARNLLRRLSRMGKNKPSERAFSDSPFPLLDSVLWYRVYPVYMRIGQIAKRAGVNVETIRFYERRGLITQPLRTTGGYREYSKEAITKIHFIKRAQELGFSLTEIAELLSWQADPKATCADVKKWTEAKIFTIQNRMQDLGKMKSSLERLAAACKGKGSLHDCPIINCFETSNEKENSL